MAPDCSSSTHMPVRIKMMGSRSVTVMAILGPVNIYEFVPDLGTKIINPPTTVYKREQEVTWTLSGFLIKSAEIK